jgi:hypothetical protein
VVPWLLDRPVKPGDDSDGIQALEQNSSLAEIAPEHDPGGCTTISRERNVY